MPSVVVVSPGIAIVTAAVRTAVSASIMPTVAIGMVRARIVHTLSVCW